MKNFELFRNILYEKKSDLFFYSPYNFIRKVNVDALALETIINPVLRDVEAGNYEVIEIIIQKEIHFFVFKKLEWDTKHFGCPVYSLYLILYDHKNIQILNSAINKFSEEFIKSNCYWSIYVPCEDLFLVQALCATTFRLVETRLNFFMDDIQRFQSDHFPVRLAERSDIEVLSRVAMKMRNRFDRVHADTSFSTKEADEYLGTFVTESIKGYADYVLVPDIKGTEPFGFLAGNKPVDILGNKISKLVLTAVDGSVQRGWLFKLLTEMIFIMKGEKANYITTITQAANRPAIYVWTKAGFKPSSVTHIFSTRKK